MNSRPCCFSLSNQSCWFFRSGLWLFTQRIVIVVRVRTAGGNTHVWCCNGYIVCVPTRPLGIVQQKNRFSAPSKQGIACSLAMERRVKTAFRQPCPFIKTQSSGDFFYDGFEYVCGVAVDLLGGYGWLFSSLDSVVLNDKSQTGEEVEIQPSGASHLQNKQCVCVCSCTSYIQNTKIRILLSK